MKTSARNLVASLLRLTLAGIFLFAGISKVADSTSFLAAIKGYQIPIPETIERMVVVVVPWLEIICSLLLLFKLRVVSSLFCLLALLAVFVILTGQAWLRGLEVSCGCFNLELIGLGKSGSTLARTLESVRFATIRNAFLLAATVFLLLQSQPDTESGR